MCANTVILLDDDERATAHVLPFSMQRRFILLKTKARFISVLVERTSLENTQPSRLTDCQGLIDALGGLLPV